MMNHTNTSAAFEMLDYHKDGVKAVDLGVIGETQYALDFLGGMAANVWRRSADSVGTYGGWRFECSSAHPIRFRATWPYMEQLATAIEAAITVHTAR